MVKTNPHLGCLTAGTKLSSNNTGIDCPLKNVPLTQYFQITPKQGLEGHSCKPVPGLQNLYGLILLPCPLQLPAPGSRACSVFHDQDNDLIVPLESEICLTGSVLHWTTTDLSQKGGECDLLVDGIYPLVWWCHKKRIPVCHSCLHCPVSIPLHKVAGVC